MGLGDIFRIGGIVLPENISPGVVSFLYSVLTGGLWMICLTLGYVVMAKHVSLSPIENMTLRQLVLLNEFGTFLNPHPARAWWMPHFPYPFERRILYRGTAIAVLTLLVFPRAMVAWSELLTDTKEGLALQDHGRLASNTSMLFPRAPNESRFTPSGEDLVHERTENPHWQTPPLVHTGEGLYYMKDWLQYLRLTSLTSTMERDNVQAYPSSACFHPSYSKMSKVEALCEGIEMQCTPLPDDKLAHVRFGGGQLFWNRNGTDGWNVASQAERDKVGSLEFPQYSAETSIEMGQPGLYILEPLANFPFSLSSNKPPQYWNTDRIRAPSAAPFDLASFAMVLPYSVENLCEGVPDFDPLTGTVASTSRQPNATQEGWRVQCTDYSQSSMVLWMGSCSFSVWRGRRTILFPENQARNNVTFAEPVDDSMRIKWQSFNSEFLPSFPVNGDARPGLLLSMSSLEIDSLQKENFTVKTTEQIMSQLMMSYMGHSGPWKHEGEVPAYTVDYIAPSTQVVIYLYPLYAIVGFILVGSVYYACMPFILRREAGPRAPTQTQPPTYRTERRGTADKGPELAIHPAPWLDNTKGPQTPSSRASSMKRMELGTTLPYLDEKTVREVYTDNVLTAHGLARFLINHARRKVDMSAVPRYAMESMSIYELEKLMEDVQVGMAPFPYRDEPARA